MASEPITIFVDEAAAKAFKTASPREQEAFSEWFAIRLRRASGPAQSLGQIMDEIGYQAQGRGMTPEILDSIVKNEN